MGKFYGQIGYAEQVETTPGIWQEQVTERNYVGDLFKNVSKIRSGENLNDDLTVDNRLSIVADPYAYEKFHTMRYVRWMGALWKIISVEVQRPRLILSIGGVYNGATPKPPGGS
jgi:hypothetical protein